MLRPAAILTHTHPERTMKANHPVPYLVAAAFGLSVLLAGCGLKGPLYMPDQKAGQTQTPPTQKADEQKKSETEKK